MIPMANSTLIAASDNARRFPPPCDADHIPNAGRKIKIKR
jgi:hypothetical protein